MGLQGSGYKWRNLRMIDVTCIWVGPLYIYYIYIYTLHINIYIYSIEKEREGQIRHSNKHILTLCCGATQIYQPTIKHCASLGMITRVPVSVLLFFCKMPRDEESCRGRLSAYSGRLPQKSSEFRLSRLDFEHVRTLLSCVCLRKI